MDELLKRLKKTKFRSRFHLSDKDKKYVQAKSLDTIRVHAKDIIKERLAPAVIPNDGKQTPTKGHPVFIAQHATASCCRNCLYKWHRITPGREMTEEEQRYIVDVIMAWIEREMKGYRDSEEEYEGQMYFDL